MRRDEIGKGLRGLVERVAARDGHTQRPTRHVSGQLFEGGRVGARHDGYGRRVAVRAVAQGRHQASALGEQAGELSAVAGQVDDDGHARRRDRTHLSTQVAGDDHGFTDVLTLTFPTAAAFEAKRVAACRGFAELIARAKAAGRLRADFSPEDLVLLLMANAGVVAATADAAPEAWRRLVAYMTQAFAAGPTDPLPPAPTPAALYRAMPRLSLRGSGASAARHQPR